MTDAHTLKSRCDELLKVLERIRDEASYEGYSPAKQLRYIHGAAQEAINKAKKGLL